MPACLLTVLNPSIGEDSGEMATTFMTKLAGESRKEGGGGGGGRQGEFPLATYQTYPFLRSNLSKTQQFESKSEQYPDFYGRIWCIF